MVTALLMTAVLLETAGQSRKEFLSTFLPVIESGSFSTIS
jgi:hypothetical protein